MAQRSRADRMCEAAIVAASQMRSKAIAAAQQAFEEALIAAARARDKGINKEKDNDDEKNN